MSPPDPISKLLRGGASGRTDNGLEQSQTGFVDGHNTVPEKLQGGDMV